MKDLPALKLLPCLLFLAIVFRWQLTWATSAALRADLTHVDSGRGFTNGELLRRMAARSTARAASLRYSSSARPGDASKAEAVTVPMARGNTDTEYYGSEYLIHFGIGTPRPQPVALELDTGSDLIWTQCGCIVCFDQPLPLVDTSASATVRGLSCTDPLCRSGGGLPLSGCAADDNVCFYVYAYADQTVTTGKMMEDTFTFRAPNSTGIAAVPSLRFGCGVYNTGSFISNESGVAGFARGPLSLPSQLQVTSFSYCLTAIADGTASPMFLGTPDSLQAQATGPIQSTPFAPGPAGNSFYYLSLQGITVGKTRLPFNASAVFESLQEAFVSQMPLPVANNSDGSLCFAANPSSSAAPHPTKVAVPKLTLHLDGADWDIPRENYMLHVQDVDGTGAGDGLCLVIDSSGVDDGFTIIGNFQQQNTHIVYDLEANKMSFAPARCNKL
ncbi:hypothetical protein QYE76_037601 [Lolium multiflorum]|uniref:Peptidase A1 domain-containing protein n=1 Tax=Lolium multiflorum TaxID=4521 RepID=A0AAD8QJ59_LOLMU|nr:hypothetical protein QYE76_037601 [Lolium multiflorum]